MGADAVITWVDGSDPVHRRRLDACLAGRDGDAPCAANATRFDDAGELSRCIASILLFAPWLRNIHIVTAGQVPALMRHFEGPRWQGRVRIVDHAAIFEGFERHLPTFNSRSIISVLWRIPSLAERFVYFNDDFMLLQPVGEDDFFRGDDLVLRGRWRWQSHYSLTQLLARLRSRARAPGAAHDPDANARAAQESAARMAGFHRRYFRLCHSPYPLRRSVLEAFFAAHPDLLERNIRHRLRSPEQFKAESLAAHLALAGGRAVVDKRLDTVLLKPDVDPGARMHAKMQRADRDAGVAFACVQSLDLATPGDRGEILRWLDRRIGKLEDVAAAPAADRG